MKKILVLILVVLLCCGCTAKENVSGEVVTSAAETETFYLETTVQTEPTIAETTEPDDSISVLAGSHCRTYTDSVTNDYLDYYLFVPENAVKNMPLIIFLHGDGEVGNLEVLENFGMMQSAREIYGEVFPFIAISPCTRVYSWINGSIPDTLMGLIREIAAECEVDPEHIIITGHSRGAIGTWHLVSTYGDFFSAAVPVSCESEGALNYDNLTSIPIWAIAGSYDTYYLDNIKSLVAMIRQAGGDIELTILEDCYHGETSTRAYTREVFEWMCEQ